MSDRNVFVIQGRSLDSFRLGAGHAGKIGHIIIGLGLRAR